MSEEIYGWLFVDEVPLLYDEKSLAKQMKIETWLDLYQFSRELNLEKTESRAANPTTQYVV